MLASGDGLARHAHQPDLAHDIGPASFKGNEDMAPAELRIPTAPQQRGGTVFRITDFPPDSELGDPKAQMASTAST